VAATSLALSSSSASVSAAPVQAENSIEDLLAFLHAQAGFETGASMPPTFNSRSASPFGTAAHATATDVLGEMKGLEFLDADRIYSEVRVVNGVVTQIGGTPGGAAGTHNIDIMVARPGTTISVGDSVSGGVAEMIGDLKYGGGVIDPKYAVHGSPTVTLTGRTTPGPVVTAAPSVAESVANPSILSSGVARFGIGLVVGYFTNKISVNIMEGNQVQQEQNVLNAANHVDTSVEDAKRRGIEGTILGGAPPGLDILFATAATFITNRMYDMVEGDRQHFAEQTQDVSPALLESMQRTQQSFDSGQWP
jgi:hypothetical protein